MSVNFPCYCVINYQSELGIDNKHSYNFWFTSSLIRVIADKPFGRGDILKINEVNQINSTEWHVNCEVIGDPELDIIPSDVYSNGEVPTLIFVTTKIYVNENSEYYFYGSDNVQFLITCSSIMNNNKPCTAAILINGKQGKLHAIDKLTDTRLEWLITDGV